MLYHLFNSGLHISLGIAHLTLFYAFYRRPWISLYSMHFTLLYAFHLVLCIALWTMYSTTFPVIGTVLCVRRPRLCGGRGGGRASAIDGESTGGRRASAAPRVPVGVVRGGATGGRPGIVFRLP